MSGVRVGPPADGLVQSEVDGRVQLLSPVTIEACLLDGPASDVWRLCDGASTLDEIVEALAGSYGVEPDLIRADVRATIADLQARRLLGPTTHSRVALEALGSVLALDTDAPTADALRGSWAACLPDERAVHRRPATVVAPDVAIGPLEGAVAALNREFLERYSGLALHAGVVGDERRLVVLPGASGHGKTTLTAACVQAGWAYVSDEALCLHRDTGCVEGYPKPLSLDQRSLSLLGLPAPADGMAESYVAPGDLGDVLEPYERTVSDVVDLVRVPGASPELEPLHRADSIGLLLPRCFNHYLDPVSSFLLLSDLARQARCWRLTYDEPGAAAEVLLRRL